MSFRNKHNILEVSANYTIPTSFKGTIVATNVSRIAVTLPSIITVPEGRIITILSGNNVIDIDVFGSDEIQVANIISFANIPIMVSQLVDQSYSFMKKATFWVAF